MLSNKQQQAEELLRHISEAAEPMLQHDLFSPIAWLKRQFFKIRVEVFLKKLDKLDLQGVRDRLAQKPGASPEQVDRKISIYRFFLIAPILNPFTAVTPLPEADEVWHAHVLYDTVQYRRDCKMLYGYELRHCDRTALPDPEAAVPMEGSAGAFRGRSSSVIGSSAERREALSLWLSCNALPDSNCCRLFCVGDV